MPKERKRPDPVWIPSELNIKPKLERLCRMLEKEKSLPRVYPYHAVIVAVEEAIERRKK